MGRAQLVQRLPERFRVQQVGRDRLQAVDVVRRTPCEAGDVPALTEQMAGEVVADDAAYAGDQGRAGHGVTNSVLNVAASAPALARRAARSSGLRAGGGDTRLSTGSPIARKYSS